MTMYTNDLKLGTRVKLAIGWEAVICDNKKGSTRMAKVEGVVTEIGSVYAHDIVEYWDGSKFAPVDHTANQVRLRDFLTLVE